MTQHRSSDLILTCCTAARFRMQGTPSQSTTWTQKHFTEYGPVVSNESRPVVLGGLTVFDLRDVARHNLWHGDLDDLALADDGELLLLLDAALQPAELLLLGPVVEGRDQHHDGHREEDGGALDPARLGLAFVLHTGCCLPTAWGAQRGWGAESRLRSSTESHVYHWRRVDKTWTRRDAKDSGMFSFFVWLKLYKCISMCIPHLHTITTVEKQCYLGHKQ